jgi:hypothetical protein
MESIFGDGNQMPVIQDLKRGISGTFPFWNELLKFTLKKLPGASAEWNYSGAKFGWSFRVRNQKRTIIYLLPRAGYFKVAMVFGQNATNSILQSEVNDHIKKELKNAKPYAEGRGIRIDIKDAKLLSDIKKLRTIKIDT